MLEKQLKDALADVQASRADANELSSSVMSENRSLKEQLAKATEVCIQERAHFPFCILQYPATLCFCTDTVHCKYMLIIE